MPARRSIPAVLTLALAAANASAQSPLIGKAVMFEKDVLPILAANCLKCHGAETRKSGLDLRSPAAMLKGGDNGPVLVKGKADKSPLYELTANKTMPPEKAPKLTEAQLDTIRRWIEAGAPTEKPERDTLELVSEKDRQFWSFRPPVRPAMPAVKARNRARTPIDTFILEKLEAKGLTLSADADRQTLLRRISFDLIGLPPSPEEIDTFLADARPDAYERLVDRLLASPHHGERWGRHWLDAAGYSDSVGGDNDPGQLFVREGMWRYRDYVVRSLNADKPYDRFLLEQIAGDEMEDWRSAATLTPEMKEHLIATGFLRVAVDHTTEMELNRPFERYQNLHDTIENVTSNLLGLTVACARCHDHKFDPIPQSNYYGLMAVLKPSLNPEAWVQPQNHHLFDVSAKEKEAIDKHNAEIDRQVADLNRRIGEIRNPIEKKLFEAKLATLPEPIRADVRSALAVEPGKRTEVQKYLADKLGPLVKVAPEAVMGLVGEPDQAKIAEMNRQATDLTRKKQSYNKIQATWEKGTIPVTHVLRRGNHLTPGPAVEPGHFTVLTDQMTPTTILSHAFGRKSSGRRTAWAKRLIESDHPLTARVFVNRVWQHYFGEGIVATLDNFGRLGARPTHPELLDWLAVEFVQSGWSMKALHRLIVLSSVYRQSSTKTAGPSVAETVDPGNQLLARMRLRRLESEAIRDSVLAVSGTLDRTPSGPPVTIEPKADGMVVTATGQWKNRRSIYLFARRNYNLTMLGVFDQPVMATNCTRRISSAVPLQSLTLLNDAVMFEQADRFACRVAALAGPVREKRIEAVFLLAVSRSPTPAEISAATALLDKSAARFVGPDAELKALARLCHMLMCTNEFLYLG